MGVPFWKYSATGNDFILIDDRELTLPVEDREWIRRICTRRTGVGADGVIFLQPSRHCDFCMRHFNSDGSEAEMCGNGARSIVKFARQLGIIGNTTVFESMKDRHRGMISPAGIKIEMNPVRNLQLGKEVKSVPGLSAGGFVEIGVPHYVLFTRDVHWIEVDRIGAELAHHPDFPAGTNVNFVAIVGENELHVRTFERGVEAETLSCGTGAAASAIIAHQLKKIKPPVSVWVSGGQLTIEFDSKYRELWLSGSVEEIYRGELIAISPSSQNSAGREAKDTGETANQ